MTCQKHLGYFQLLPVVGPAGALSQNAPFLYQAAASHLTPPPPKTCRNRRAESLPFRGGTLHSDEICQASNRVTQILAFLQHLYRFRDYQMRQIQPSLTRCSGHYYQEVAANGVCCHFSRCCRRSRGLEKRGHLLLAVKTTNAKRLIWKHQQCLPLPDQSLCVSTPPESRTNGPDFLPASPGTQARCFLMPLPA